MSVPDEKQFRLSRLSLRRKANQINLLMLLVIAMAILVTVLSQCSLGDLQDTLANDLSSLRQSGETAAVVNDAMDRTGQAISAVQTLLLVLGILAVVFAVLTAVRSITVGLRAVALEVWIRRMGAGDLDYKVEMTGKDEIVKLAIALEELRQRSIKAMQLNLVERLSKGLQEKNEELERVVQELRQTQDQVITRQKLVELGELTAGVAHEIRNPLNFITNFSEASEELLDELKQALVDGADQLDEDTKDLIAEISQDLADNMQRIHSHGDRANRIVRDMLAIGRGGGKLQPTDINDLVRDHAMLAFHGARALDEDFQLDIRNHFDPNAGEIPVIPDDMGRVFLNLVGNACYATDEKRRMFDGDGDSYTPTLWLCTERTDDAAEIRIRDNGTGIPLDVIDRIFNPFFTTKPTDKGTGLGLSLSNDIVRQHGGSITPASKAGEYTEMTVSIPISGSRSPAK
ncbi:MAG: ATP-binding protein [Chloroflexi bacterium]|nr:ATP-binding protein [Chloroflexota bacterium]